jgi:RNA polymerase sigma-70 factor (ECF subfamily)
VAVPRKSEVIGSTGESAPEDDSDEALVARAVGFGDTDSFGILVDRYQSRVRAYLRQMTREPAAADDLAQETFIRAWTKMDTFSGKGSFSSWLMAIAHNQFLQTVRQSQRQRRLVERLEAEARTSEALSGKYASPSPSELPDLPRLLAILSGPERSVMLLGYGFGYSHGEIADITGLALGTVKSHIHRGKARIRETFRLEELDNA